MEKKAVAFDLGASSGRAMAGSFDGEKLTLKELHRFSNDPVMLNRTFYWDFIRLMHEIKIGIGKASREGCTSIGVDTWGVDFGLIDKNGRLIDNPVHYRDERNVGMSEELFKHIPADRIYGSTGIQIMDINTIYQLYYLRKNAPELLEMADSMLFIPDLINYYLSGARVSEYSIASTSQLLSAKDRTWDLDLIGRLGVNTRLFRDIVMPGTPLGGLRPYLAEELGVGDMRVVASAGHDTAAAVAAVPVKTGESWAFLSSGTWSLLGMELSEPMINDQTRALNFTNEGGLNGTIRFLKNIIGLWLMQESRRQWIREGENISFKDMDVHTAAAKPFQRFINPDYPDLGLPGNMPKKIASYCSMTNQPLPETKGDITRCITESLAMKYRENIEKLEKLAGKKIDVLHVIGGGVQDQLLCRFTANATGKTVVAGPIEATAIGNLCTQFIEMGCFKDLSEARECVARSFPTAVYEPEDRDLWESAYDTYRNTATL